MRECFFTNWNKTLVLASTDVQTYTVQKREEKKQTPIQTNFSLIRLAVGGLRWTKSKSNFCQVGSRREGWKIRRRESVSEGLRGKKKSARGGLVLQDTTLLFSNRGKEFMKSRLMLNQCSIRGILLLIGNLHVKMGFGGRIKGAGTLYLASHTSCILVFQSYADKIALAGGCGNDFGRSVRPWRWNFSVFSLSWHAAQSHTPSPQRGAHLNG